MSTIVLSPKERVVLDAIDFGYAVSFPEVVLSTGMGPTEAQDVINRLIDRRLIERTPDTFVRLTTAGRSIKKSLNGWTSSVFSSSDEIGTPSEVERALNASINSLG